MYKIKHNLLSAGPAFLLMALLSGCAKYLDKKPDNILSSDLVWQTRANAEAYLYQVYGYVQAYTDDYTKLGASDETSCSIAGVNVRRMVTGNWSPQSGYFYNWGSYYAGIRQSLVFEANVDRVPATALSDDLKTQYKAEAVFLRGWFYWNLLRQYGPFLKLTHTLSLNENYNVYARAPFDTCVAYINQLMDQAAQVLPVAWTSSSNYGRPTKGACLAVKSQLALLAASPLWNGNPRFASFKNQDGTALAPASYDAGRWKTAANAAKAVIDLNAYRLFTNIDEGDGAFDPYLSCRDLFLTNWNNEMIFTTNMAGTWQWGQDKRCTPSPGGINMTNATQNVVDAFYMRNGRTIDDTLSGYTETGFAVADDTANWGAARDGVQRGYITGNSNMYVGREARFYAYIQYNGKPVLPAPTSDDRNFFSSSSNQDGRGRAEFYYSGKSGVGTNNNGDYTGYDALKNVSPASNIRNDNSAYRPYIHIRYAEILLNYVEALNEYDPSNPDILTYLNMIRTRAGLPNLEAVYPSAPGNQVEMRKRILQERQIELCFESDRYYTLIRRLMMSNPGIQSIYRMNTIANDNNQGFAFTGFYTRILFQNRYWDDKMYLFPMAQDDIDKDNAIVQNPGW